MHHRRAKKSDCVPLRLTWISSEWQRGQTIVLLSVLCVFDTVVGQETIGSIDETEQVLCRTDAPVLAGASLHIG